MKIKKLEALFPDVELRQAITNGKKEVSENEFASHLFQSNAAKREDNIIKFLNVLKENAKESDTCVRILAKYKIEYAKYKNELSEKVKMASDELLQAHAKKIGKREDKKAGKEKKDKKKEVAHGKSVKEATVTSYVNDGPVGEFDKFPKEWCALFDLKKRAAELSANNNEEAEKIIKEIKRRTKLDPAITAQSQNDGKAFKDKGLASRFNPPFDYNRTGRDLTDGFLNASDVRFVNRQNYILSGLVKSPANTRDYFEAALSQGTKLFVSAHETGEASSRASNFWKNEVLSQIRFRDGSTITNVTDKNPKGEKTKQRKEKVAHIVANTLQHAHGTVTHLHIDGWRDRHAMGDEAVLVTLLDEMDRISPSQDLPIAINCKGGVGRTGTIALSRFLRREVDAQLAAGKKLEEISVNIPEVIYAFRKQRQGLGGESHLAQVYSVLGAYVERLKQKEEWRPDNPSHRGMRYFIEYAKRFNLPSQK